MNKLDSLFFGTGVVACVGLVVSAVADVILNKRIQKIATERIGRLEDKVQALEEQRENAEK